MVRDNNSDAACIRVFANICASISHDIKNSLAIINENSGLMEDMAEMMSGESGVSREQIMPITTAIGRQVERANRITGELNRFAHSNDSEKGSVDLQELFDFVGCLLARQLSLKEVSLENKCVEQISVSANVMKLYSLFYVVLRTIIEEDSGGNVITIATKEHPEAVAVMISSDSDNSLAPILNKLEDAKILADAVNGKLEFDRYFEVVLPIDK